MFLRRLRRLSLTCTSVSLLALGCGARTAPEEQPTLDALAPFDPLERLLASLPPTCADERDCVVPDTCLRFRCEQAACVPAPELECDDGDDCTLDHCQVATGECEHTPATPDRDGDGHRAPLPGFRPGSPGSCGDDCDDGSADAFPGGSERCDGRDNDCNGVVDDGWSFAVTDRDPVLISSGEEGSLGGIIHDGDRFVVSLSSHTEHLQNQLMALDASGSVLRRSDVALVNSDTFAGPVTWGGAVFATVWEDRRDDDYEIYFNRLDANFAKLGPDVRLTHARGFSLEPDLVLTEDEYVSVWQDRRYGSFRIFGQRISLDGVPIGENVELTPEKNGSESPSLEIGKGNFGLVFNSVGDGKRISFRTVSRDLATLGPIQSISDTASAGASLTYRDERYVVVWSTYDRAPGDAIWGAVLDAEGNVTLPPRRITEPADFARSHHSIHFGDRILLFWAQWTDGSYQIHNRWLNAELEPLTSAVRITDAPGNALGPATAFSPNGELGLVYADFSDGSPKMYFTTLVCE